MPVPASKFLQDSRWFSFYLHDRSISSNKVVLNWTPSHEDALGERRYSSTHSWPGH